MNIRGDVSIVAAVLAAICVASPGHAAETASGAARAGAPACAPRAPGQPRTLLDGVPSLISAQMTPTRGGGVVIAFSSFRGSREFPGSRFTVLALDAAGCKRWRASLAGGWPLARPVQPDASSIVVGSASRVGPGIGALDLHTLSAATGRVLRKDRFVSMPLTGGSAPVLLTDARGDVAAVLATSVPSGRAYRSRAVTVELSRNAGVARWRRLEIAGGSTARPAAAARQDGRIVVGYPRRGRFVVRAGTIGGGFGAPADAGPVGRNFRSAAVALGSDGTAAAVWQSTTYSRPWRLRAAVRPPVGRRFARYARLGAAAGRRGTLFEGAEPAAHVGPDGRVTVGFVAPDPYGHARSMCATAMAAGHFGSAQKVATGAPGAGDDLPAMVFGRAGAAAVLASTSTPDGQGTVSTLVTLRGGCGARASARLDPAAGPAVQAAIDARGRTWVLGQERPTVDAPRPLVLTIMGPIG